MATGNDHYQEAERLLLLAQMEDGAIDAAVQAQRIAAAQVHATLALVAVKAGHYTQAGQDNIDFTKMGMDWLDTFFGGGNAEKGPSPT